MNWLLARWMLVGLAVGIVVYVGFVRDVPLQEHKKVWSGRSFEKETTVKQRPYASNLAPGFDSERVWSGQDDWERHRDRFQFFLCLSINDAF